MPTAANPMPTVTYQDRTFKLRSRKTEIPDLTALDGDAAQQWLRTHTYATGGEQRTAGVDDLEGLARLREERWQIRRARIMADPTLDPRIKKCYLDRTICDTKRQAEVLGYKSPQRVSAQRETAVRRGKRARQQPHPALVPTLDTVVNVVATTVDPGIELGRLLEWAVQSGKWSLDPGTCQLRNEIVNTGPQSGRVRVDRATLSRPNKTPTQRKQTK